MSTKHHWQRLAGGVSLPYSQAKSSAANFVTYCAVLLGYAVFFPLLRRRQRQPVVFIRLAVFADPVGWIHL